MNKKSKKLLTRYTKRVLSDLGILIIRTKARHPLLLDGEVRNFLAKHPGVTRKFFSLEDPVRGRMSAAEIQSRIIFEITRAKDEMVV